MRSAPFLVFLLCGCAGAAPDAEECRRANWYDLGFRDAMYGLQRQDDAYAWECAPHHVKVDAARYVQGWTEGRYEFDRRTSPSQD